MHTHTRTHTRTDRQRESYAIPHLPLCVCLLRVRSTPKTTMNERTETPRTWTITLHVLRTVGRWRDWEEPARRVTVPQIESIQYKTELIEFCKPNRWVPQIELIQRKTESIKFHKSSRSSSINRVDQIP